jgi:hypothetical protein
MKKHLLTLAAFVLIFAGSIVGLTAQETPARPGMGPGMMMDGPRMMMGPGRAGMMRMMIVMLDTDGDGMLSLEEVQAVHARMFKAMDVNKDGRLTAEEMQRFMQGQ